MGRIHDAGAALREPKVHDIVSMGKHENDGEAKKLLQMVAKQVQPIMRKRDWMVPLLSEFLPPNASLLGLNIGGGGGRTREIKVRLRRAHAPLSFLPYESVLETMLHELVHNVRGPHDSVFYKLLDELKAECEDLMARGISGSGAGFDGPSAGRLGSHSFIPAHNPPANKLRDVALRAAEERAKRQRLMASGPCRLGGDSAAAATLRPGQAAALAAERRQRDNLWCPCERISQALAAARGSTAAAAVRGSRGSARAVDAAGNSGAGTAGAAARGGSAGARRAGAAAAAAAAVWHPSAASGSSAVAAAGQPSGAAASRALTGSFDGRGGSTAGLSSSASAASQASGMGSLGAAGPSRMSNALPQREDERQLRKQRQRPGNAPPPPPPQQQQGKQGGQQHLQQQQQQGRQQGQQQQQGQQPWPLPAPQVWETLNVDDDDALTQAEDMLVRLLIEEDEAGAAGVEELGAAAAARMAAAGAEKLAGGKAAPGMVGIGNGNGHVVHRVPASRVPASTRVHVAASGTAATGATGVATADATAIGPAVMVVDLTAESDDKDSNCFEHVRGPAHGNNNNNSTSTQALQHTSGLQRGDSHTPATKYQHQGLLVSGEAGRVLDGPKHKPEDLSVSAAAARVDGGLQASSGVDRVDQGGRLQRQLEQCWACALCTFLNKPGTSCCDMCCSSRPAAQVGAQ